MPRPATDAPSGTDVKQAGGEKRRKNEASELQVDGAVERENMALTAAKSVYLRMMGQPETVSIAQEAPQFKPETKG